MKHLLLSRFQGALIGANTIYIDRQQLTPNQLILETTPALMAGITSLANHDRFDVDKWLKAVSINPPSPDRVMVVMLPLMLFFHDDRLKLRQILIDVSHAWQLDWETCSSAIAIGYIISRSLTESFDPITIIPQLLDEMNNLHPLLDRELSTIFPQRNATTHRLLDRFSSLEQITQKLAMIPHPRISSTAVAIYCFLSTPEDFSLAIRRAYQVRHQFPLICALTGILAGTQNSLAGIPLNGFIATQKRSQWLLAAEDLLNSWAGMDPEHSSTSPLGLFPSSTVASPQVMQQRD